MNYQHCTGVVKVPGKKLSNNRHIQRPALKTPEHGLRMTRMYAMLQVAVPS